MANSFKELPHLSLVHSLVKECVDTFEDEFYNCAAMHGGNLARLCCQGGSPVICRVSLSTYLTYMNYYVFNDVFTLLFIVISEKY